MSLLEQFLPRLPVAAGIVAVLGGPVRCVVAVGVEGFQGPGHYVPGFSKQVRNTRIVNSC